MNLAWLAAVLQPHDIAPDPSSPDGEYDFTGPAALATIVLADSWRLNRLLGNLERVDLEIRLASRCIDAQTIGEGTLELFEFLSSEANHADPARAVALSLFAASVSAELDDYRLVDTLLERATQIAKRAAPAERPLLAAAVLQQRSLRAADRSLPHTKILVEARSNLSAFRVEDCGPFPLTGRAAGDYQECLRGMVSTLTAANNSLVPVVPWGEATDLPEWFKNLQASSRLASSELSRRTSQSRLQAYAQSSTLDFEVKFESTKRYLVGPPRPDFYGSLLQHELAGHGTAYEVRKDLAVFRLRRGGLDLNGFQDCLRLLRQSQALAELELAAIEFRRGGPLEALARDARRIISGYGNPLSLSAQELVVLREAADVLAAPEAAQAFAICMASLEQGESFGGSRRWMSASRRLELLLVAIAALATAMDDVDAGAAALLSVLGDGDEDPALDAALRRAFGALDIDRANLETRESLAQVARERQSALPATSEALLTRLGHPVPALPSDSAADTLARKLNRHLRDDTQPVMVSEEELSGLELLLSAAREEAARGMFTFGGDRAPEVCAGLIVSGVGDSLWVPLVEFLADHQVPAEFKGAALDRLTVGGTHIPDDVRDRIRHAVTSLLYTKSSRVLAGANITPYPPALRFLCAHILLSVSEQVQLVAELAARSESEARVEAAETIFVMSRRSPGENSMFALALMLTRDSSVKVRASAAASCVAAALSGGVHSRVENALVDRVGQMLMEDGVLVPIRVVRALKDLEGAVEGTVGQRLRPMLAEHRSRLVRAETGRLFR